MQKTTDDGDYIVGSVIIKTDSGVYKVYIFVNNLCSYIVGSLTFTC